jgi:hypothetical protein
MKRLLFAGAAIAMLAVLSVAMLHSHASASSGPCGTSHDGVDSEEAQFLGMLQAWRDSHLSPSTHLEQSGALNAAAAWFAEDLVTHGAIGGHGDSKGRSWVQRAADCGYDPFFSQGSGEGVYALSSSIVLNVGPTQAIAGITYPGSGVYIQTPDASWPAKCVGVAVYRNAARTSVAWVAVIAQFPKDQACPASTASSPPPATMSPSPSSPSPSPSPTPTRTPTPATSPGGLPRRAVAPLLSRDDPH